MRQRFSRFLACAVLGLSVCVISGCGEADPVAATSSGVTIAPTATQGAEGADKAQAEMERKQAEADKAAGRR
jgi:hypothetical protein